MTRAETIGWIVATWLVLLNPATPPVVMAEEATPETRVHFNIPRQPADLALTQFAEQANLTLLFPTDGVQERTANELVGEYALDEAIDILLAGTGLAPTFKNRLVLDIAIDDESTVMGEVMNIKKKAGLVGILAGVFAGDVNAQDSSQEPEREKLPIEEIVVTGTHIRGIAPESSPVRVFDREDIQISGAGTAQDFIQTLTANFGGGSNPNIPGLPTDPSTGGNSASFGSFGSSVNLRGLGSGATLVLINGHRVAPASFNADFTDISMIPASAIERVETLTDGASSIYGSDAVAGVINFILRDDFDGLEASTRFGTGTEHGTPDQYRANITGGRDWESGHALVVYEFFNQDPLSVEDRTFAANDFVPSYLLPSQKRHSALVSAAQNVTSNFELFADFAYSDRKARQLRTDQFSRSTQYHAASQNLNVSSGGAWEVSRDWFFDFSGAYSKVDTRNVASSIDFDSLRVNESDIWMADAKLSGSLFRLPGGDVKLAFGGHYRTESFLAVNELTDTVDREANRDVYALFGEAFIPIVGSENRVPGIERLELNASGRLSDYSDFGSTANPKVGLLWSPLEGLNFRGTYSTSFKAPELGRVGDRNFAASALRTSLINSIFGLTSPDPSLDDAVVLTVNGTAKDLDAQTSRAFTVGVDFHQEWGANNLAFSSTWFDIDFEGRIGSTPIPGNLIQFAAVNMAFIDPDAFPEGTVIFSPTMEEISSVLDSLDIFGNPFGLDPFDAVAINFVSIDRNLSRTVIRGFDFDTSYTYDLSHGSILIGLDGTYLQDVQQQAATTTPLVETVDTLFNPVDLKLRGRAGYSGKTLSTNVFVNFVDDYHVDNTGNAAPIDPWTTVDLNVLYDATERLGDSFLNNTILRLSVINVFDNDPPQAPITATLSVDGFDPTNASPLGRFISVELTKRW